ncbi:unnamed protein product [Enterobius vermicularis]|uniref:MIT domain-containing protein n=1 Tax=Enterobius vermicularis TaxID=51028 RepID=A0A0N4VL36_ENTVE|nr:unnamed protein product [Enterobius vermicularis]
MHSIMETSKPILQKAVQLDTEGDPEGAIKHYAEGVSILMKCLSCDDASPSQLVSVRETIGKYLSRAETLKNRMPVVLVERIQIKSDSKGYGYDKIFSKCFDNSVTEVFVQDGYIRLHHQIVNFVKFCELCVMKATNLKKIELRTQKGDGSNEVPLMELKQSFEEKNVIFSFYYDENLHDREIRFNNGWIVKIGRGLDYFKKSNRFALGSYELNLRKCLETTVDLFQVKK